MKKENRYAVALAVVIHVNHYHCYLLQNPNSLFTLCINKNYPLYNVNTYSIIGMCTRVDASKSSTDFLPELFHDIN